MSDKPGHKKEIWKPVQNFPGYYVSSKGTVHGPLGRPIGSASGGSRGYLRAGLMRDGKMHLTAVHKVVLEAFVGPRPHGTQCRHLDGDKTNNALSNLCWGTAKENACDRDRHGTTARGDASGPRKWIQNRPRGDNHPARRIDGLRRGSKNGRAELTETDIPVIRARAAAGDSMADIASDYGLTTMSVYYVVRRKTWRHVI